MDDTPVSVGDEVRQDTIGGDVVTTITRIDDFNIYTEYGGGEPVYAGDLKSMDGNYVVRLGAHFVFSEVPF